MPSFDIVSELNLQEVDNAFNQAKKEIEGRYDFKGSHAELKWDKEKKEVTILAEDDYKVDTMLDILQNKMGKRGVDLRALKPSETEPAGGRLLRKKVVFSQGIEKEVAKEIIQYIKNSKLKVQAQIMDDKLRVTSKSIDELQSTMQSVRTNDFKVPLQFNNMRS
ncbi:MAG: YajQ family cyclic di-GMP-binding protein [Pseudobdellovibrio sp.]